MIQDTSPDTLHCANHPQRETYLRCNRCDKPICSQCAISTPTGYRCKECVRGLQKVFETAHPIDYPIAVVIAGVLSFIGSLLASVLGFFIILIGPVIGLIITEIIRWGIRRRRAPSLFLVAAISAAIGSLPLLVINLIGMIGTGFQVGILGLVWQAVYSVMITTTVYYRLSGIQL
ncbi:MAG TPA: hypothetical protein VN376_03010 [Longilinea sp.]|nr:hypothetical protein [Longilinea sp.]